MVTASAHLFYGIFVTLPSLLIAANAHRSPQLLALDLISLRARRGNLATESGCGGIVRVPLELWLLVRAELEDIVWIEAENELVRMVYGDEEYYALDLAKFGHAPKWSEAFEQDGFNTSWGDELGHLLQWPFNTLSKEYLRVSSRISNRSTKECLALLVN